MGKLYDAKPARVPFVKISPAFINPAIKNMKVMLHRQLTDA